MGFARRTLSAGDDVSVELSAATGGRVSLHGERGTRGIKPVGKGGEEQGVLLPWKTPPRGEALLGRATDMRWGRAPVSGRSGRSGVGKLGSVFQTYVGSGSLRHLSTLGMLCEQLQRWLCLLVHVEAVVGALPV